MTSRLMTSSLGIDTEEPRFGPIRKGAASALLLVTLVGVGLLGWHWAQPPKHCAPGLVAIGARCCGQGQRLEELRCVGTPVGCAVGMDIARAGCVPRRARIPIKGGRLELGPADWEAPELVAPYSADVAPFLLDSHEVTEADYRACVEARRCAPTGSDEERGAEPGRAQTEVDASQARAFCEWRGGSVPTRDQLAFAAMGSAGRRYPWGDTGAVCRRAAFGLLSGPCAHGGTGPQLAGAHPDGMSPDGVHDLAGNVAEWASLGERRWQARGGSWRSTGAAELRSWSFVTLDAAEQRSDVGFRCAYRSAQTVDSGANAHEAVSP